MIDYNYYTTLSDKDLEKLVSHIKNIQNQRNSAFTELFLTGTIEKVEPLLDAVNPDKLKNVFNAFVQKMKNTFNLDSDIDFYIFLKKHHVTKDFDFSDIEDNICWRYAEISILEKIKTELPGTFESFKKQSFYFSSELLIEYLDSHNFINFDSFKQSTSVTNPFITYCIKKNLFKTYDNFPIYTWLPIMDNDTLSLVRSHFDLPPFNYEEIFYKVNQFTMKDYMKNIVKYKTPDFLEHFTVNSFFVKEFSTTIDKISDKENLTAFCLKIYSMINDSPKDLKVDLFNDLKSNVKKSVNKEFLNKLELNFNLQNSLIEKNVKSKQVKI